MRPLDGVVPLPLTPPFRIGPYRCTKIVGTGGWGTVYRATAQDGSPVAVKLIDSHPDPSDLDRERFERITTRLLALDRYPNLVEVVDVGHSPVEGGCHLLWIAMPYDEVAITLKSHLKELGSPPSVAWTRKVIASLAAGLHVLHENWIIHRDLKPENVLVFPGGRVAIIDFDVACLADSDRGTPLGRPFGTLRYRAPEQLDGECCPASDLWALGVIAYEMYTGQHPFASDGVPEEEITRAIREDPPRRPRDLRPELSPLEERRVLRLLDKVAWRRGKVIKKSKSKCDLLSIPSAWPRSTMPQVAVGAEARGDVDAVVSAFLAGDAPAAVVIPANRPAPLRAAREQLGSYDIPLAVEPSVAPFAFPDWESRKTLAELPYRPAPGELYDGRLLDDPERLREVARSAVVQAVQNGADHLLAPWTVATRVADLQMLVTLRMLADTLKARDESPATANLPVIATVALPIGAITDLTARVRIANALAGYRFDAIRLALRGLGWSSSSRQILAAVDLALLLQDSGVRVSAMVSNPLRELFWAAGVAGSEGIPARRERQALPGPQSAAGQPRTPAPRLELGSLASPLPPEEALAALESGAVPETDCECAGCAGASPEQRVRHPAAHNVIGEVAAARLLDGLAPAERALLLRERLRRAERLGRALVMGGVIGEIPPVAEHLRLVLDDVITVGLLEPQAVPRLRRAS
jgi:serine/threonine protein kinase